MAKYGFYFDAESCIGCRTCQVACKDAHDLPVGENYRVVRTFVTGEGFTPRMYHLSLAMPGCDRCAGKLNAEGNTACVGACPQFALEYGDLDELRAKHHGEALADSVPAAEGSGCLDMVVRVKDCMSDESFTEIAI